MVGEASIVESMVEIDVVAEIGVEIVDPKTVFLSYSIFLKGNAKTRDGNT